MMHQNCSTLLNSGKQNSKGLKKKTKKGTTMKYIIFGIKDYCKDCWHDWLVRRLFKLFYKDKPHKLPDLWKEGSIWHYIKQRKAAKLLKEIKTLQQSNKRNRYE